MLVDHSPHLVGVEFRWSTTVCPENSAIQVADWVAPWIIGGIG